MAAPSRFAAILILAVALGACEGRSGDEPETAGGAPGDPPAETAEVPNPSSPDPAAPNPGAPNPEAATDDAATPGEVIETSAAPQASSGAVATLPPEPVKVAEPSIDDDPQQLYGLDSGALGTLLGQPSLIRNEAPAEIWQYRSQTCVFDIFFYESADQPRVTYIEARDDSAQRIDARGCLNELLRARMGLEPLG